MTLECRPIMVTKQVHRTCEEGHGPGGVIGLPLFVVKFVEGRKTLERHMPPSRSCRTAIIYNSTGNSNIPGRANYGGGRGSGWGVTVNKVAEDNIPEDEITTTPFYTAV